MFKVMFESGNGQQWLQCYQGDHYDCIRVATDLIVKQGLYFNQVKILPDQPTVAKQFRFDDGLCETIATVSIDDQGIAHIVQIEYDGDPGVNQQLDDFHLVYLVRKIRQWSEMNNVRCTGLLV